MSEDLEEKARAQAEARRQRILEGANRRMDQVSGLGDEKGSSNKLAAMRRRRFAKKKESPATTEEEETKANAKEEEITEESTTKEEQTNEETKEDKTPVAEDTNVEEIEEVYTTGTQPEEKKKYMGVAKMRRMRLQEKKQQEVQQQQSIPLQQRSTSLADRIPIYMHVLVVLLLFGAGLDVGMQLHLSYSKGDLPEIVQRGPLGPLEMKFVNIVPSAMNPWSSKVETSPILEDSSRPTEYSEDSTDEFAEHTPKRGVDDHDANIDPLFGLDLDKYTAGSGLVMFLGRQAVKVHRLNLALFYYGPRKVVTGIWGLLQSFRTVPPLLGIIALFIRQVVASALGAHLPTVVEDEAAHKDIVSTGVTMVKNFLAGSFPKLVTVYRAWTHLRSDMYVVTCGCLVGLALSHSMLVQDHEPVMEEPIGTGDEL
ncbi:hypothetical protein FisN_11Hh198 [Fistulifera solaris]|uniref:Uncharacterized protein n=1 Tax=Fistulifera solaris TaxID=1519565 RepID=A0A1Z5JKZ7_FISSO|nr:hypothetical protein FisN_11Hh198 [Fistulifera solaris]|eukprot:GAX14659.1 hypothetical protein FisN_11Hh198 [Fistulifera solaris]